MQVVKECNPLDNLASRAKRKMHPDRREIERILALPYSLNLDKSETDAISRLRLLAEPYESGYRLFSEQASAITAYDQVAGGFFPVGVGWGKTGISVMVAEAAWRKGLRKIMLLLEPNIVGQLTLSDIPYWRRHTPVSVPFVNLGGLTPKTRRKRYETGRAACYIVPYSLLSLKDTLEMIEAINPDLVIADECHNLRDLTTARTKCWKHMMDERPREFVAMSGTITSKSIEDFRHLIAYALRDNCPLPLSTGMAMAWSKTIDADAVVTGDHQSGPMEPLVDWANEQIVRKSRMSALLGHKAKQRKLIGPTVSGIREAFQMRLHSAPGVVSSPDSEVKASLSIENYEVAWDRNTEEWLRLHHLMMNVQANITPNGDEIEHSIHIFKWMTELGAGFYNELTWPGAPALSERRRISEADAERALDLAMHAHKLHQFYAKELRGFFETSPPHLATPMAVGLAISQGKTEDMPGKLLVCYDMWHEAIKEAEEACGFLLERDSRVVRVCDYKVKAAALWAQANYQVHGSALLWVYHREVAKWLTEECKALDMPTAFCPAGANDRIKAQFDPDNGTADAVTIASIKAHGTGKNLQKAPAQLFVQWPRDAKRAEQTLGRVHRNGIERFRDHVTVNSMNLLPYDNVLFAACLNDAVYQHQTDSRRKMVYASYDPMPTIFSPEFLRASGASPKTLTPQQREMLIDKFGDDWMNQL